MSVALRSEQIVALKSTGEMKKKNISITAFLLGKNQERRNNREKPFKYK